MRQKLLTVVALALLAGLTPLAADQYNIDPAHSQVGFKVRHLMSQVRGGFNEFSGTVSLNPAKLETSSVEFKIKAASIDTGVADRDKHLRSPDFFDVEKYPELHTLFNEATKLAGASGTKGSFDASVAEQLLDKIARIDEIFKETKAA